MSAPVESIEIARDEAGLRLDRWFRTHFPEVSHGYLQKLLRSGQVRVDSGRVHANARLEIGQQVRVPAVRPGTSTNRTSPSRNGMGKLTSTRLADLRRHMPERIVECPGAVSVTA